MHVRECAYVRVFTIDIFIYIYIYIRLKLFIFSKKNYAGHYASAGTRGHSLVTSRGSRRATNTVAVASCIGMSFSPPLFGLFIIIFCLFLPLLRFHLT